MSYPSNIHTGFWRKLSRRSATHPFLFPAGVFVLIFVCLAGLRLVLHTPERYGEIELKLVLPEKIGSGAEPILVCGRERSADSIAVQQTGNGQVAIVYDHWNSPRIQSAPFTIEPGKPSTWLIKFSKLAHAPYLPLTAQHLTIEVDGKTRWDSDVPVYTRRPHSVFIATNPLGGAIAPAFSGKVLSATDPTGRFSNFFVREPYVIFWLAVFAAIITLVIREILRLTPESFAFCRPLDFRSHSGFLISYFLCLFVAAWMVTYGSWQFFQKEVFGDFYDFQAASLLQGRWNISREGIGDEAFIYKDKVYGYFGPTPAVVRMPFVLANIYFSRLSRITCLFWFGAALLTAYIFLLRFRARLSRNKNKAGPGWQWLCAGFISSVGLGSTLIFLLGRSFTYHEALITGSAFCFMAWTVALTNPPKTSTLLLAAVLAFASIHCKPTVGLLAFCGVGGCCLWGAWLASPWAPQKLSGRELSSRSPWWQFILIGLFCVVGIFSFNLASYAKFENFEGAPLRYNVQFKDARLAHIQGKNFIAANIPFNLQNYFARGCLRLSSQFPFVFVKPVAIIEKNGMIIDAVEPIAAITWTHLSLTFAALIGGIFLFFHSTTTRVALSVMLLAVLPLVILLCSANAVSHRYTADFMTFFAFMAACGVLAIDRFSSHRVRITAISFFLVLCFISIYINTAIALNYQRAGVWGVPPGVHEEYLEWQKRFSFNRTHHDA